MNFISAGNQAVVVTLSSTVDVVKASAETISATAEAVKDFAHAGKAYASAVRVNAENKAKFDIENSAVTLWLYQKAKQQEIRSELLALREAEKATFEKAKAKGLDIRLPHEIAAEEEQIKLD